MAKASQAEIEIRVAQVSEWLLNGETRAVIVQKGSKLWQISHRQVDDYIAYAWDMISECGAESTRKEKARVLSNLWRLFKEAQREGDRREQHSLSLSVSKLLGLEIAPAEQPARHEEIPQEELDRIAQEDLH